MVRLEKEMAVIGVVNHMLRHPGTDAPINMNTMHKYARMLETQTGIAVVLGFGQNGLNTLLAKYPDLFVCTDPSGQGPYRMCGRQFPTEPEDITAFIAQMIDRMDPALNYPLDFIKTMGLLGSLEYKG